MSASRSTAKVVENLLRARLDAQPSSPLEEARRLAEIASEEALRGSDAESLATAVHVLASAVQRLCDHVERPGRKLCVLCGADITPNSGMCDSCFNRASYSDEELEILGCGE